VFSLMLYSAIGQTTVYYEDFRYNSGNRGITAQIVSLGGTTAGNLNKVISDHVGPNGTSGDDSSGQFDPVDRPATRIPQGGTRDNKAISVKATVSSVNHDVDVWLVMSTIDLTTANALITASDTYRFVSFWTQARYANGSIGAMEVKVSTDYVTGNAPSSATWTDLTASVSGSIAASDVNPQKYVKGMLDLSAYNSATVTVAFRVTGGNSTYTSSNRNGTWYLSDVEFTASSNPMSVEDEALRQGVVIFPNPSNDVLNIKLINSGVQVEKVELLDLTGKLLLSKHDDKPIHVNAFAKGIYILKIRSQSGGELNKKVIIN